MRGYPGGQTHTGRLQGVVTAGGVTRTDQIIQDGMLILLFGGGTGMTISIIITLLTSIDSELNSSH